MPLHSDTITFEKKLRAVEAYLHTGQSLRKIADAMGFSYKTIWFWVKQYKEGGEDNLRKRIVHKKRVSKAIELKVMYLKEQNPSLSIRRAKILLKEQGITLSNKGIWQIWKRYGIGKRSIHEPFNPFGIATPESNNGIIRAKAFIRKGNLKAAARVLNSLPCLPEDPIIKEIPEKFLSPRRRLERLGLEFGAILTPELIRKIRRVGKMLESRGYIYSSIIANFWELLALDRMVKPKEKIRVLNLLAKKLYHVKDSTLWFMFYREQATTYVNLLHINKALHFIKKCRRLVYVLPFSYYQEGFGSLITFLGKYKEAHNFYKMALAHTKDKIAIGRLSLRLTHIGYSVAGEYRAAKKMLIKSEIIKDVPGLSAAYSLNKAYIYFGQGNLAEASQCFLESLEKASRNDFSNLIYATSVGLAAVAMALNKKKEATLYLKKYLQLLKKYGSLRDILILKQLLYSQEIISKELLQMPYLRLLNLLVQAQRTMKISYYRKAFNFARNQRLLGLLHRWIVFFPAPVVHLLEKGKQTGLPRALLKFPIFNQNIPVYHVKFLGDFIIRKNQHYMRTQLSPQEKAFFIHLGMRADIVGKSILLRDLYTNFWIKSRKPADRLLHLLANLKKKLRMPSHLLTVSSTYREPRLINRGIYITTDYDEFQTLLTQAKSLERAGEWHVAQRDYMRVFSLLRHAPFEKMYDNWSEYMRDFILNKIEDEVIHFAKRCLEYNNKKDTKKVLEKVSTIIPYSKEVKKLLKETRS